ncbi:MAG: ATP-dependent DNA helicase RecG [Candidatus Yanofskybacteria bacterium]|nr:ATP-dependent DNA helicase RecG [Candidatus Yanofskybacteria bacterium]
MELDLMMPITRVRSVGTRSAARLAKLGITTVRQLLWHLPTRYEDYSDSVPIADLVPGEKQSIRGEVVAVSSRFIWPKRMTITTATLRDASGAVRAVWFNQPYIEESLTEGTLVSLSGKVVLDKRGLSLSNPLYERVGASEADGVGQLRHTGRLIPIYSETAGVTSKYLRFLIQPLIEQLKLPDPLPESIRREYGLPELVSALTAVHYPQRLEDAALARERLAFDDLLLLQLKALRERRQMNLLKSVRVPMDAVHMKGLIQGLPFSLTRDQRVAILEVLKDMERPYPMNRLLEGDVGSGKTVVALLAAMHAAREGHQTVILAPTEVLAVQHERTLRKLLSGHPEIRFALLTGTSALRDGRPASKAAIKRAVGSGAVHIVIGTHAVIRDDVRFPRLALVVIDEQHRFGIHQRATLMKAERHSSGLVPHLLSMTATPIPRTLALTVLGDLDSSIIKEKPAGRQPVQTQVVPSSSRDRVYEFIRGQVREGRQVFVVCPVIEVVQQEEQSHPAGRSPRQGKLSALWAQVKAVQDEYAKLSKEVFPDLRVVMLHGRMKSKEKQEVMHEFKEGWHDILVSTSVIEVGVDVSNATIMLIEGADRFGLAQLHQFRGRVGRGGHASYCFLFPTDDGAASARLSALETLDDGFALAEADMKLRGPGEFFGIKQSGMPDITMEALGNPVLIKKARAAARVILKADPGLKHNPLLAAQLAAMQSVVHSE